MKTPLFCRRFLSKGFVSAVASLTLFFSLTGCDSEHSKITLGSGNKGGVYYKFANELSDKLAASNANISIQVKTTAGTNGNMRLLKQGFIDAAIVQSDVLKDAVFGNGEYNDNFAKNVSALGALYTEAIQIVASANSGINEIQDLIGKRVSVGEEESGVIRNAKIILDAYGISFKDIKKNNLGFAEAAQALQSGKIDAFFCTAGVPTPAISELAKNSNVRLLSIKKEDITRIERQHSEFIPVQIDAGTYNQQETEIQTIGMKAVLVANANIPDEAAQALTKAIFEKVKDPGSSSQQPTLEFATTNVPAKFHPGAAAYYSSRGIQVIAKEKRNFKTPIFSTGD